MVSEAINWNVFWRCWQVTFERYLFSVRTPWFQVMISGGDKEWDHCARWYGLRVYWGHTKNWQVKEGGLLFHKGDPTLSFYPLRLPRRESKWKS